MSDLDQSAFLWRLKITSNWMVSYKIKCSRHIALRVSLIVYSVDIICRLIQVVRINNIFWGGFCLLGTCIFKNHGTLLHTLFLTKIEDRVRSDINMVLLFVVLCWISSTKFNMFCIECLRLPWLRKEKYRGKCTTPLHMKVQL